MKDQVHVQLVTGEVEVVVVRIEAELGNRIPIPQRSQDHVRHHTLSGEQNIPKCGMGQHKHSFT